MTTTTWTTTGDIPAGPWAQLVSDTKLLLGAMITGGSKVTGPDGRSAPQLGEQRVSFIVTAADRSPLAVNFHREVHDGEVETASTLTDGLVLMLVRRATKHWGALVSTSSDADTAARTVAAELAEALYGAGDRAVSAYPAPTTLFRVSAYVEEARAIVQARMGDDPWTPLQYMQALMAELGEVTEGVAIAAAFASSVPGATG